MSRLLCLVKLYCIFIDIDDMKIKQESSFLKPTKIFMIVGIFIPGFTAIGILGLQMLITLFGIECSKSWNVLWFITSIGSLISPLLFQRYITTTHDTVSRIKSWLTFFNIIEYLFIQATLGMFFTNGTTLCYVSDGQNGIEFGFTAWLALPFIYIFSLWFNKTLNNKVMMTS